MEKAAGSEESKGEGQGEDAEKSEKGGEIEQKSAHVQGPGSDPRRRADYGSDPSLVLACSGRRHLASGTAMLRLLNLLKQGE